MVIRQWLGPTQTDMAEMKQYQDRKKLAQLQISPKGSNLNSWALKMKAD